MAASMRDVHNRCRATLDNAYIQDQIRVQRKQSEAAQQQYNASLQLQQAQVNQVVQDASSNIKQMVDATNLLIKEDKIRTEKYNELLSTAKTIASENDEIKSVLKDVILVAQQLREDNKKKKAEIKELKELCNKSVDASQNTSENIANVTKLLLESKKREKKLKKKCKALGKEVDTLTKTISGSDNERVKIIKEQNEKILLLSLFVQEALKTSDKKST